MIRSTLRSLGFVVVFTPLLATAQEIDVQTTDGLVTLDVETTCGSTITNNLSAALEIELAAWRWREAFALCVPALVRFAFERCDGPGTVRIVVAPLEEELPSGDVSTRALTLAAAELLEGAYRRCAAHASTRIAPPSMATQLEVPWHDHRPRSTDADQARYYHDMELLHRLARRTETVQTPEALVRMRAGAFFDSARDGAGGFANASLSTWVAGGLLLRAELGPAALALGGGPGIGQLGGSVQVGYDLGLFAFALGGGLGTGNGRPGAPLLARIESYLRLGLEPGAFMALLITLDVDEEGVNLGLVSSRIGATVSRTIGFYLRAELALAFASARADFGLQIWLDGDIASTNGVALEVGISGVGVVFTPRCAFGPCRGERTFAAGPGAHLGLTLRGGD